MTDLPSTEPNRGDLFTSVANTVNRLQAQYLGERGEQQKSAARGTLAVLRRAAGQPIDHDPLSLQRTLLVLDPALEEAALGRGDDPSRDEYAAFHALSLFALHMQSARSPMHQRDRSFGSACGRLTSQRQSASLKPRFDAILLARSSRTRLAHTRSLITLLRSEKIGFDYARFAQDLRALENPRTQAGVLLRWGRDFASGAYPAKESPSTDSSSTDSSTTK